MLATHAELQMLLHPAASLCTDAHEFANAVLVDRLERIALQQPLFEIRRHHPALDIVAAETKRHLGEVVGAEAEEVGLFGDLVGAQRGSRGVSIIVPMVMSGLFFTPFNASSISACTQLRASAGTFGG